MKSKQAEKTTAFSVPLSIHLSKGLKEGALIGLLAIGSYLFMALISYSPQDPGWSYVPSQEVVIQNAAGRIGAWFADVLLSLVGYLAYAFPLMCAYRAWIIFRDRHEKIGWNWHLVGIRALGLLLLVIATSGLLSLHISPHLHLPEGVSSGGYIGLGIANFALSAFNPMGSTLILLSLSLIGLTIFAEVSWLKLMDIIGKFVLDGFAKLREYLQKKWYDLQENRAEKIAIRHNKNDREAVIENAVAAKSMPIEPLQRKPIEIQKPAKVIEPSPRILKEKQGKLFSDGNAEIPPLTLLDEADNTKRKGYSTEALDGLSRLLELKLKDFGVIAQVVAVQPGPVITRFEIQPAAGVKVSQISNLVKDLARSLAVLSVRVVEVIPGKSVVGIEIPNEHREIVNFREVLASSEYDNATSPLSLVLGKDISGYPVVVDLAKMPHLLVAGTTGSGKSVGVNAMILSLLFKSTPRDVRLIMIDPKMLELSIYEGIPHLLTPVVTDMKDAAIALRWSVGEMERRYRLMASLGVRNILGYNKKVKEAEELGTPLKDPLWKPNDAGWEEGEGAPDLETLPYIVIIVDEFADMMMVVGKKVEELIARIAQKARAAGIHLILATQRPSVDVITGLIKANIPTRISFQVSSKTDSRTILDQGGGEQLLGHGDMLYLPPGTAVPNRVHGAFVSDGEVHRVVKAWKELGEPNYLEEVLNGSSDSVGSFSAGFGDSDGNSEDQDPLYDEAVAFVIETRRASISSVQRKLKIGYNRAARMIESMENAGLVSAMNSSGGREVLVPPTHAN